MRRGGEKDAGEQELAELAALADGSLPADRRAALEARVESSPDLAGRLAEQERVVALIRSAAAEVEAPPALRARIESQRPARKPRRGGRRLALIGGAAAVAAAAAVAIGVAVSDSEQSGEQFHAALGPTDLVPGAAGDVTLTKTESGWRIELDATGLPRLDDGRFYQAWLRNAAGTLVPIGSFNEGENVTLWAGISPVDFPLLTVTRERADGDQASSGEKVLVGTVDASG
jgi:anti-sigma-K factor RskA